ncbi:MAG: hypothetical protein ACREBP_00035 [Sphingomicrobium sp.]
MDLAALKKRLTQRPEIWHSFEGGVELRLARLTFLDLVRAEDESSRLVMVEGRPQKILDEAKRMEILLRAVCDWKGVTLADLGDETPEASGAAPFDPELCLHFLAERPQLLGRVLAKFSQMAAERARAVSDEKKASQSI